MQANGEKEIEPRADVCLHTLLPATLCIALLFASSFDLISSAYTHYHRVLVLLLLATSRIREITSHTMLFTKREAASRWIAPLLLLLSSSIPCLADQEAFFQDEKYNHEDYGRWVTQKYKTSSIEPPRLNFMQPFTECDDGSYLFIAPRGDEANASFYIMDHEYASSSMLDTQTELMCAQRCFGLGTGSVVWTSLQLPGPAISRRAIFDLLGWKRRGWRSRRRQILYARQALPRARKDQCWQGHSR